MQIINPKSNFDFVGKNRLAVILCLLVILAGIFSLVLKGGPSYGVDFSGGTLVQIRFSDPVSAAVIKDSLAELKLDSLTVQQFGDGENEFLIRAQQTDDEMSHFTQKIEQALKNGSDDNGLEVLRSEMVCGPRGYCPWATP